MNNEYIGVKHFDELVSVIDKKALDLIGADYHSEGTYPLEAYKEAFETLVKHVRGYAQYHDNGSLLWNIAMESVDDCKEDAFMLIQDGLAGVAE